MGTFWLLGGFQGLLRLPEPSKHLAPRNAAVGGGWPVKAASGRQPCSSQTSRGKGAGSRAEAAAWARRRLQNLPAPGAARRGMEPAPEAKRRHKCTAASPRLVLMPPRASVPRRQDLFFSVPPGAHIYIYTYFYSASSCRIFPHFLRFCC